MPSKSETKIFTELAKIGYFIIQKNGKIFIMGKKFNPITKEFYPIEKRRVGNVGNCNGYANMCVTINKQPYFCPVHRIIWSYFNGDIPYGMLIHHKNKIRNDNRLINLELLPFKQHSALHYNKGES